MTFYLKPPRGYLNLHKLEECVKNRLIYYDSVHKENIELFNHEYLVEDSALDRTGHFVLRLLAYFRKTFQDIFLKNELELLEFRLNSYDPTDVKHFLKRLLKHSRDSLKEDCHEKFRELCLVLMRVSSSMLLKGYLDHVFHDEHTDKIICEGFLINVPFQYCSSLVKHREVDLNAGFAVISCVLWKKVLIALFGTFLKTVLREMKLSRSVDEALSDDRIRHVLKLAKDFNSKNGLGNSRNTAAFDITKIDRESEFFPLCMLNLYKILEKTNRLPHNDRFDFSLYLKGIGVSLNDSLKFWEDMYSKEHSSCSRCTHSWQKNQKRYIYGIRHLYGLEGSRTSYQSRSCRYLQNKDLGARDSGGCPFKHFDDDNLRRALQMILPKNPDEVEVMIYERKENPSVSCKYFYETIRKGLPNEDMDDVLPFQNPVQYYTSLKKDLKTKYG
ncbi:unnamed protein product [Phaedon cochleariae]|uniref:DNA primase large subunit C-terminal domain-containing protein n=1 Tax=Phaedon cochleariae TaxID=80249 RepID=A0A9P0DIR7_PHACE|nr:unnamed protein product [Phaedon cochleariae]